MDLQKYLLASIETAVKEHARKEWDAHIKEHLEYIEKQRDAYIAGIVLNIQKSVQIETLSDKIIITVTKK